MRPAGTGSWQHQLPVSDIVGGVKKPVRTMLGAAFGSAGLPDAAVVMQQEALRAGSRETHIDAVRNHVIESIHDAASVMAAHRLASAASTMELPVGALSGNGGLGRLLAALGTLLAHAAEVDADDYVIVAPEGPSSAAGAAPSSSSSSSSSSSNSSSSAAARPAKRARVEAPERQTDASACSASW